MVAILYQILGLSLAWIVREVLYVPMDFQWGILVVCPFLAAVRTVSMVHKLMG